MACEYGYMYIYSFGVCMSDKVLRKVRLKGTFVLKYASYGKGAGRSEKP